MGTTNPSLTIDRPAIRLVILAMLFISLSFAIAGWLHGERPDQIVQFLFFILLLSRLIKVDGRAGEIITAVSYFSWSIFMSVNWRWSIPDYAFEDPPQMKNGQASHYYFGRLKVSV